MAGFNLTDADDFEPTEGEDPSAAWDRWQAHEDAAIREHVDRGWTPGHTGKGVMDDDRLYLWLTDGSDGNVVGAPHHGAVRNVFGLSPSSVDFSVEPDGGVRLYRPARDMAYDEALAKIVALDLRLHDQQEWQISKVATRIEDVESTDEGDTAPQSERPFVYDPVGDVVYVGSPGSHHDAVLAAIGSARQKGLLGVAHGDGSMYTFNWIDRIWDDATKRKVADVLDLVGEDEDDWTVSKQSTQHNLNWRPGAMGKGFLDDEGRVHTFSTGAGKFAWYNHADLANAMGVDIRPDTAVFISPAGAVDGPDHARRLVADADPNLHVVEPEEWHHLGGVDDDHHLDWDPALGFPGKGMVIDGVVYTWPTYGDDERPWHKDYATEHHLGRPSSMFYIDPNGGVFPMWDEDVTPEDGELIAEVDPRLVVEPSDDWTLTSAALEFQPWGPGFEGKGVLHPDGSTEVWRTFDDDGSGTPHHADWYDHVYRPGEPYPRTDAEFRVDERGNVELLYVPAANKGGVEALANVRQRIETADPRLDATKPSWTI